MIYFEPLISLLIHSFFSFALCSIILSIVYFLIIPRPNSEKNIAYECGFKPFTFTYSSFDVQFYRVGILFLLFDVEIIFLFPWVLNFYKISMIGHFFLFLFIITLLFGFIYEIKSGALIWYPQPLKIKNKYYGKYQNFEL